MVVPTLVPKLNFSLSTWMAALALKDSHRPDLKVILSFVSIQMIRISIMDWQLNFAYFVDFDGAASLGLLGSM